MWGDNMINYGIQRSTTEPPTLLCTATAVFEARNIKPYTETIDEHVINGYEYEYYQYTKDEYILKLAQENATIWENLIDTQMALCDIYESLEPDGDLDG